MRVLRSVAQVHRISWK